MKPHFYKEIRALDRRLYQQAVEVEEMLGCVVIAFLKGDTQSAARLIEKDTEIDRNEIALEEECLKVLALYQPVAGDLRYVITVLKVNAELERIGDLAVDIAGFTTESKPASLQPPLPVDFESMTGAVRRMLDASIKALSSHNVQLAADVIKSDCRIDELHERFSTHFPEHVRQFPEDIAVFQALLGVSRSLERIADCATNIAEDVIYLESGRIVRHAHGCLSGEETPVFQPSDPEDGAFSVQDEQK